MDSSTPPPTSSLPIISDHPIQSPSPSPSPSPLKRRSKTCLADRLEIAADDSPEPVGVRRRGKARVAQNNARKTRKPRAGADVEIREESKDSVVGLVEEIGKPRKRARLGWDSPEVPKAQVGLFFGQDVANISSSALSGVSSEHITSSLLVKGVARNGSPHLRHDDKDGHYMFAVGEILTSRYKIHSKMGEGTFGQVLECWDRERKEMVAIKNCPRN